MASRHFLKLILGLVICVAAGTVILAALGPNKKSAIFNNKEKIEFIDTNFYEFKELMEDSIAQAQKNYGNQHQKEIKNQFIQLGVTSHHLPTAAEFISDFYVNLYYSRGPRDIFVILGPDHFERGYTSVSTAFYPFITPFGELKIENSITEELIKNGVNIDNEVFKNEHSIGVQAILIKSLFPQARIVPLIFQLNTDERLINNIAEVLNEHKDKITVISSVDFSHYQPYEYAQVLDKESKKMISDFNFDSFTLEYADSPPTLKLLGRLTDFFNADKIAVLDIANSYDFTKKTNNTTGYINALFTKDYPKHSSTLMFVGDIMLSRSVGEKMKKENNWRWPFLEIADYLKEADLVFGNLEGPISDKGKKTNGDFSFRADPKAIEGLKYAGFNILSVANNHIGDWGKEAMEDTFKILKENNIGYIGGGHNKQEARSFITQKLDNGTKIAFLAYTNLVSRYWEAKDNISGIAWLDEKQMKEDIEKAKKQSDIIAVSMHFGEEYNIYHNKVQQFFARTAIDNGADLVIGHHPHVIQEIEKYKEGYIAYSLGNFVFDQLFSQETTQGLILKVLVEDKKIKDLEPVKIKISNSFQPSLIFGR
ncbi:MAG: AmmeMemoRadiSam system protein B [Candidatus Portnoybacteria bacterium RIFCSPLOWO2_01_FULL_43_11]|uniref:AmmeMemoRadiSam system protein B n=2 Tax=Candidatus Portnoyibacteriota TaxID=1817913 RepID=A0A1G2FN38_9BACT|nr:MAG: AmmeMemoRadiSam system protein B [Candidatus Portnoybacteria bacterium RIFCSPLOWO2_01_FULL_43_11]